MTHHIEQILSNIPIIDLIILSSRYKSESGQDNIKNLARLLLTESSHTKGTMTGLSLELKNAIDAGDTNKIEKLLCERGDYLLNKTRASYLNPLIYASFKSNRAMVKFLLEKNFVHVNDIYFYDTGIKPQKLSSLEEEQIEIVRQFEYWNKLTKEVDTPLMGKTALLVASDPEIVKLLLKYGANPNIQEILFIDGQEKRNKTALMTTVLTNIGSIQNTIEILKLLVNSGADVRIKDMDGNTVFDYIIGNADNWGVLCLNELIKAPNSIEANIKNINLLYRGKTILIYAIQAKNLVLAEWLINHGADINISDSKHINPIVHLILSCNDSVYVNNCVQFLISIYEKNLVDDDTTEELFLNIEDIIDEFFSPNENIDNIYPLLKVIIHYTSNLDIVDNFKQTLLLRAITKNKFEFAKILLKEGADPNIKNWSGKTAIFMPFNELKYPLEIYKSHNRGVNRDIKRFVNLLIRYGADINMKNDEGETILFMAVDKLSKRNIKFLLKKGADINIQNNKGETVLMNIIWKVRSKMLQSRIYTDELDDIYIDILKFLIKKGANMNLQDEYGMTALRKALDMGQIEAFKILLLNGADVNIQDTYGNTELMRLIEFIYDTDINIIELLLVNGAKINLQNKEGKTALMMVAQYYNDIIQKLIKLFFIYDTSINVNIQDNNGMTALSHAIIYQNIEMIKILVANGARLDLEDVNGDTALTLAKKSSNKNIIKFLKSVK